MQSSNIRKSSGITMGHALEFLEPRERVMLASIELILCEKWRVELR
jgi:hypothetical protein